MMNLFLSSLKAIKNYTGMSLMFVLVLLAWLFIFLREKRTSVKVVFTTMPLITMLIFICPITPYVFNKVGLDADIYYRLLWMIPMGFIAVYGLIILAGKNWLGRALCCVLASAFIILTGKCIYSSPIFFKTENWYGLPQQTIDIVDFITEDADHPFITILPSADLITTIRQYDSSVRIPYGRDTFTYTYEIPDPVYVSFELSERLNFEEVLKYSRTAEVEYIVIHAARLLDDNPEEAGLIYVGCVDDHLIYKDPVTTDRIRYIETFYQ